MRTLDWPCAVLLIAAATPCLAQDLPRYTGGVKGDGAAAHDGKLRPAIGVQNVQIIRSAPGNPSQSDGTTTIYRHASFIAHWGGLFWVMHEGSGARLAWSKNGLDWSAADSGVVFQEKSHHRMAFYGASNGRFLASHWIGDHKGGHGNRLVREILGPNSYGPVYSVKANYAGPYPQKSFPDYATSTDAAFKAACKELLDTPVFVQQWQEEDNQDPSTYTVGDGTKEWRAFSWYRLPDDRIVGSWKGVFGSISSGSQWARGQVSAPKQVTSFGHSPGAKTWGQRTEDGRYAMVGCSPGGALERRWPLTVTTSRDGLDFDGPQLAIAGELPPQRYENAAGDDKNSGPQYVRGICPGNGDPPGSDMWLTYSMNKEDIWVARVPVPVQYQVKGDVLDDFQGQAAGRFVSGWNTYSPQWAPVTIVEEAANRFLRLDDHDPVDYASVTRVFQQGAVARLAFKVRPHQLGSGSKPLEIDVVSADGARAVAIAFDPGSGQITAYDGKTLRNVRAYTSANWIGFELAVDATAGRYDLAVDGVGALKGAAFHESASTVERVVFRTGAFRLRDFARRPYTDPWLTTRLPNGDATIPTSTFDLDDVVLRSGGASVWTVVNNPGAGGNAFGWSASTQRLGGTFARSRTVRYCVNTVPGRTFHRSDTFTFTGEVTLSNRNFDGSFFLGFCDKNDLGRPISIIGLTFDEPTGGASNPFRARATIRTGSGSPADVSSPVFSLAQNTRHKFDVTWHGRPDGSGTLVGTISGTTFSIAQGPQSESLNAFGLGVGLAGSDDASHRTGPCYFENLKFSAP